MIYHVERTPRLLMLRDRRGKVGERGSTFRRGRRRAPLYRELDSKLGLAVKGMSLFFSDYIA